jgi:hypothetical protein
MKMPHRLRRHCGQGAKVITSVEISLWLNCEVVVKLANCRYVKLA